MDFEFVILVLLIMMNYMNYVEFTQGTYGDFEVELFFVSHFIEYKHIKWLFLVKNDKNGYRLL